MSTRTRLDERRRSIVRDLAESAHTGAPPLGHLAGLWRRPADDTTYELALDPDRPMMAGGPGLAEFAMLADLALGGAIRNQVGLEVPLPTISMTVQIAAGRTREVAWANGECTAVFGRTATSRSQLRTINGDIVGDATGVFALPKLPYDGPGLAMPWDIPAECSYAAAVEEDPSADDSTSPTFDDSDKALVDRITAHAESSSRSAWGTLHVEEQMDGENLTLTPTEPMANRLGNLQGGVLLTTAVLAASRTGGFPVDTLATTTIDFLAAADLSARLVPEVTVLKAGGRSLFTRVDLIQGGNTCCQVTAVFRR